jgi:hypothetical protein
MSAYSDLILSEAGLAAYYRYEEPSGTAANDSKGTNDGTHVGGAMSGQTSLVPQAADFSVFYDGTNDGTTIPSSAALEITGELSLEAWIKPQALTDAAGINTIFAKYLGGNIKGYELYVTNEGAIRFTIRGGGVTNDIQTSDGLVTTAVVYYLVATYKDSTDTANIYVDAGSRLSSSAITTVLEAESTAQLVLGGRSSTGTGSPDGLWWEGWLDELAIYNVELTPGQVLNHYLTGTTSPMEITSGSGPAGPFGAF